MEKHIDIDCTLIKNHPDCNAYMDYLVDNHFIHNVKNLPDGILPFSLRYNFIDFIFNDLCVQKISVPEEPNVLTDMAVLINMDCTRIELLINADGSGSPTIEHSIARKAFAKYLNQLNLGTSEYNVVFHLGEVLREAYQDNGEEHELPSGLHYKVVDTPFHGDIISNILNNISIHQHDKKVEKVITEALGITREQAKFDHVFYPDTKLTDDAVDEDKSIYDTNFTYRSEGFTLILTADEKGHQNIKVQGYPSGTTKIVEIPDIHDLKSVIDREFFNNAPEETPKEEPEAEPEEVSKVGADISVTIKVNAYIDSFHRKANDIIAHTEEGTDWLAEFGKTASPKEVIGYYFYTYGTLKALEKWKKNSERTLERWKENSEKSERIAFVDEVNKIFDSIFCPFCKQKKRMSFSSIEVSLEYQKEGKVYCYNRDEYKGCMIFPICPQCGSKLE